MNLDEVRQNIYALNHSIEDLAKLVEVVEGTLFKSVAGNVLNALNEQVNLLRKLSTPHTPVAQVTDGMPRVSIGDPQPLPPGGQIQAGIDSGDVGI